MFAIRDGRAHQVLVDVGETDGMLTVIQRGLAEAERIIAQPSDSVIDGTPVRS